VLNEGAEQSALDRCYPASRVDHERGVAHVSPCSRTPPELQIGADAKHTYWTTARLPFEFDIEVGRGAALNRLTVDEYLDHGSAGERIEGVSDIVEGDDTRDQRLGGYVTIVQELDGGFEVGSLVDPGTNDDEFAPEYAK